MPATVEVAMKVVMKVAMKVTVKVVTAEMRAQMTAIMTAKEKRNKKDAEKGEVSAAQPSPLNTPLHDVGNIKSHRQHKTTPKKLSVEILMMTQPLQFYQWIPKQLKPETNMSPNQLWSR